MVQTIKVSPAETDESPLGASNESIGEQQSNSPSEKSDTQSEEKKSKTKQYILFALVIFNTITCIALIITLPIVLTDSSPTDEESLSTVIPDYTTPTPENAVLVLHSERYSERNDRKSNPIPFVLDFDGKI